MKKKKNKKHIITTIRLRDLIIAELIGAAISGLIAGLIHIAYNNFHLEDKVDNVCDILNKKDQKSCRDAVNSIMDAAEKNADNYTVKLE